MYHGVIDNIVITFTIDYLFSNLGELMVKVFFNATFISNSVNFICGAKRKTHRKPLTFHTSLTPLYHIFLIECANTYFIVFGLTRQGFKHSIYHTTGQHDGHFNIEPICQRIVTIHSGYGNPRTLTTLWNLWKFYWKHYIPLL